MRHLYNTPLAFLALALAPSAANFGGELSAEAGPRFDGYFNDDDDDSNLAFGAFSADGYFAGLDDDETLEGDDDEDFEGDDEDFEGDEDEDEDDLDEDDEDDDDLDEDDEPLLAGKGRARRFSRRAKRKKSRSPREAAAMAAYSRAYRSYGKKKTHKKAASKRPHTTSAVRSAEGRMNPAYLSAKGYDASPIAGAITMATKGKDTITIDVESRFVTQSLTFEGSAANALVFTVWLGEDPIWRSAVGVPCSLFSATGLQTAANLAGRVLAPNSKIKLDIETAVNGDTVRATILGYKKIRSVCR